MLLNIWFFLWALLWAIYFVLDGFDFGMGILLPFLAKNDKEKRIIYNSSGPYWDGNEVWLITAGGVTFAAFPLAYATMFSALYAPLLILLFALIFRAVAFEFRNKSDSKIWKTACDVCLFLGNLLPGLLLGVAFANLFQGIPVDVDGVYHGNTLKLLNPYGLVGGLLFVLMFMYHGALWLNLKATGDLCGRAYKTARGVWAFLLCIYLVFLAMTAVFTNNWSTVGYNPFLIIFLVIALAGLFTSYSLLVAGKMLGAWACSAAFILGSTLFGILGMFPNLIISSLDPAASVNIYNGSSSPLTLKIMLVVALIGVPIVLAYQAWVYYTFSHRVSQETLESDHAY